MNTTRNRPIHNDAGAGRCARPQGTLISCKGEGLPRQLLLLLLGSFLQAAEIPSAAFFPQTPGCRWVYDTFNKETGKHFDMTVIVENPKTNADKGETLLTQKDERGTMREFLTENEKGIFITKLGLSKSYTPEVFTRFTPPVPRVIFPLVPGTTVHWEGRLKVAWVDKPIIFDGEVVGWDDIGVPAGKFHCLRLHYHEKRGAEVIDEDAWYAAGIGQVKYDGGQYVKELKSFRAGE